MSANDPKWKYGTPYVLGGRCRDTRLLRRLSKDDPSVAAVGAATEPGYWMQAEVGAVSLLACRRRPGEPYRPLLFATHEEAAAAAQQTAAVLFPPPGVEQELYFNLRYFAR